MNLLYVQKMMGRRLRTIMWLILGAFMITGVFLGYGSYRVGGGSSGKLPDTVARVGKQKITRAEWHEQYIEQGGSYSIDTVRFMKQIVLDQMINAVLLQEGARSARIKLSGREIERRIEQMVEAQVELQIKSNKKLFKRHLQRMGLTLNEYKEQLKAEQPRDEVEAALRVEKLYALVTRNISVSDKELMESFDEYKADYVWVKSGQEGKEAAKKKAEEILQKAKEGIPFDKLKEEYEGAGISVVIGEDWHRRGSFVPSLEEALFKLEPGQVGESFIEAPSGFYLVKLNQVRNNPPPDFEEEKRLYKEQLEQKRKNQEWQKYLEDLKKRVEIKILDPELAGYDLLAQGKIDEAIKMLQKATELPYPPIELEAMHYALGVLWEQKEKDEEAMKEYEEVLESAGASAETRIRLGQLFKKQGKKKEALEQFKLAKDEALDSIQVHRQLKEIFEEMGEKELAEAEQKWLEENPPPPSQFPFTLPESMIPPSEF